MSVIKELEPKIAENGTLVIDSIFRFSEKPTELPAFLQMCKMKRCIVKFELENLICEPDGDLRDCDSDVKYGSLLTCSFIAYMTFYQKFAGKHFDYLMNLASKKDDFVKAV